MRFSGLKKSMPLCDMCSLLFISLSTVKPCGQGDSVWTKGNYALSQTLGEEAFVQERTTFSSVCIVLCLR